MSSELENQIKDDLFRDKVNNFFSRYKKYLITILILLITIPSFYHAYKAYERNQSEKIIESYSQAMLLLKNENLDKSSTIFAKLLEETDEFIIVSSLNQLVEINIKKKEPEKNIILIDSILNSKKLSQLNVELLKIKKALLIFDKADEKTMLDLLNKNDKQNKFYSLSMQILNDYYISKNEISKGNEIQKLVNEK
jgi:hypothetical protein